MNRKDIKLLALLWSTFLIRGFFYAAVLPIWEGYDEPYHFAYIQCLAATHKPPTLATPISRQVDASLHVLPLPWMLKFHAIPQPLYTHDDFWRLPAPARELLMRKFEAIPPGWGREPSLQRVLNYEAQQPPLYYLLSWPVLVLLSNASLETQILTLRFVAIVLASVVVPIAYLLVWRITRRTTEVFSILGLALLMPELYINLARVSNEAPAAVIYTALLYVLVCFFQEPPRLFFLSVSGVLVGLGLLTKAYFLTSVPALVFLILVALWRWPQHRMRLVLCSLMAAFFMVALASPWYLHVHQSTGSWSGLKEEAIAPHSLLQTLGSVPKVNWLSALRSIIISHTWFGAWSFLKVGKRWYLAVGGLDLLAVGGIILFFWRTKYASGKPDSGISPDSLIVMTCVYAFFYLGLAYDVLLMYMSIGASSSAGWYSYCLVAAEAMLLFMGIRTLLPASAFRFAIPLVISSYALLDLYGTHFLLIPYYTGLISHDSFDQVHPVKLWALAHVGASDIIQRVTTNKPAVLSPTLLTIMWLLYSMVTIFIALLSWRTKGASLLATVDE